MPYSLTISLKSYSVPLCVVPKGGNSNGGIPSPTSPVNINGVLPFFSKIYDMSVPTATAMALLAKDKYISILPSIFRFVDHSGLFFILPNFFRYYNGNKNYNSIKFTFTVA